VISAVGESIERDNGGILAYYCEDPDDTPRTLRIVYKSDGTTYKYKIYTWDANTGLTEQGVPSFSFVDDTPPPDDNSNSDGGSGTDTNPESCVNPLSSSGCGPTGNGNTNTDDSGD